MKDSIQIARLVEGSELAAYSSLINAPTREVCKKFGFHSDAVGSAVAVRAAEVASSLNLNRVIGLGVFEPATQDMLEHIANIYAEPGVPYAIELSPLAAPVELPGWLKERRIRAGFKTAVFFYDMSELASQKVVDTDLRVECVGSDYVHDLAKICAANFEMPDPVLDLLEATAGHQEWRQWLAFDGEEPVAAALSFQRGDCGWLGWDATQPSHRGRRAQAALIAARLSSARESGCNYVTAETELGTSSNPHPSYLNYSRMGFRMAYERRTYVATRARTAMA